MLHHRKSTKHPVTKSRSLSLEAEQAAIKDEVTPSTKYSFQLARIGPSPLSSLVPLIPMTCIAVWSLVAGYFSGDWRVTHYVLILECLFGGWMLYEVLKQGMKTDIGEAKREDLPI